MRTVSKAEMRLVKIWLSHVGGVAVLRFLFTYDRRGTNAGLDLPNSEETDCSDPHSAPRPPSDLLGQLLGTNQKRGCQVRVQPLYSCSCCMQLRSVLPGEQILCCFSQTRNQWSAWTCDKRHTYCTVCTKCQGLASSTREQLMHEFRRGILCTLQAVPPTAQGQGRFFHKHSAFMCFYLTALF